MVYQVNLNQPISDIVSLFVFGKTGVIVKDYILRLRNSVTANDVVEALNLHDVIANYVYIKIGSTLYEVKKLLRDEITPIVFKS